MYVTVPTRATSDDNLIHIISNSGVTMTPTTTAKICWICGKSVNLEECKVDARGLAVHEDFYVLKLKLATSEQPIRKRRRP